ncbi:hypothetical protein EK21DRAFT_82075 [Setomelanomma holmii]|uniref:Uncharacterized protein n=1 Tax=Setomelanomma holmii TaxID=210430 RepID=A0A9P4LE55_9PLEO|nr:hypothetical protein EK21DRAFT_82075 [Setomelanomma holmii]
MADVFHELICSALQVAQNQNDDNTWTAGSTDITTHVPSFDGTLTSQGSIEEPHASSVSSVQGYTSTETKEDDDEEFGEFQSASVDPFAQPVYIVREYDEADACLSKTEPEPEQSVFVGFGLVQPVHARFDDASRGLRRAGKLWLRMVNHGRAKKAIENITLAAEAQVRSAFEDSVTIPIVPVEDDQVQSAPSSPALLDGVMCPVSFASTSITEVQHDAARAVESLIEEEKQAWID